MTGLSRIHDPVGFDEPPLAERPLEPYAEAVSALAEIAVTSPHPR